MVAQVLKMPLMPDHWRVPALAVFGLIAALLLAYYPTAAAIVTIWSRSETFTHAFVVPPIVLWLAWRLRAELAPLRPAPMPWVLLPMACAAAAWLLGSLVQVNAVMHLALAVMLVLTVPLLLGWQVTWVLLFPLAFFFFAVPIGEFMTPWMVQWTADFTVTALRASGIPIYREGMQFVIPSGSWSVVEACSGVRYLMASVMVGSLFAYLNYTSTRRRVIFMAVAIAVPIVANWLRAYMIVMLGHLSNNQIATGVDHLVYGWVFFGIVIMAMFFVGARWAEPELPVESTHRLAASPVQAEPRFAGWALAAVLTLAAPAFLIQQLADAAPTKQPVVTLPATLADGWQASSASGVDWRPIYVDASAEAAREYTGRHGEVGVYVAYYRDQNEARKLVSSTNMLVRSDDFRWNALRQAAHTVASPTGDVTLRTTELLGREVPGRTQRLRLQVWQVYWVGGHLTSSGVMAKLWTAWQRLRGLGDESAAVVLYAQEDSPGAAKPVLETFWRANFVSLQAVLESTKSAR